MDTSPDISELSSDDDTYYRTLYDPCTSSNEDDDSNPFFTSGESSSSEYDPCCTSESNCSGNTMISTNFNRTTKELTNPQKPPKREQYVAISDSEDDMCMSQRMHNKQTKRVKRRCPLPGCEKRPPLVRLSNHIRQYHQINSGTERQKWLFKAKNPSNKGKGKKILPCNQRVKHISANNTCTSDLTTPDSPSSVPSITNMSTCPSSMPESSTIQDCTCPSWETDIDIAESSNSSNYPNISSSKRYTCQPSWPRPSNTSSCHDTTTTSSANATYSSSLLGPSNNSHDEDSAAGQNRIFSFDQFKEYLQGIAGGNRSSETATAIVRDVQVFFETITRRGERFHINILLNQKNLERFYHFLKTSKKYKPSTNAEKLRRLKMAIRFAMHNEEDQELYIKGCRYIDLIKQWVYSLSKSISLQRQRHSLNIIQKLPSVNNPLNFLENPLVNLKIQHAIAYLKTSFDIKDVKLLTAFAAAVLIYRNCQRSGVVQNLTIQEFDQRQAADHEKLIVSCINHKTGPQGRAQLVITKQAEHIILMYKKLVREHIQPATGYDALLFLTPTGKKYTQVYRKITEAAKINGLEHFIPPPPKMYRIVLSTEAARSLNDCNLRMVARHLSHSETTSRQYYEFSNTSDATEAHDTIQELARQRYA